MPEQDAPPPAEQVARAKRLREQIEALRTGKPQPPAPGHQPSIREQIEERAREKE